MKDIKDYKPEPDKPEPDFPDTEMEKSENIKGKTIVIEALVYKEGSVNNYFVIRAREGDRVISFANGGSAVKDKLSRVLNEQGFTDLEKDKVMELKEEVTAVFTEKKSANDRNYYDLE